MAIALIGERFVTQTRLAMSLVTQLPSDPNEALAVLRLAEHLIEFERLAEMARPEAGVPSGPLQCGADQSSVVSFSAAAESLRARS